MIRLRVFFGVISLFGTIDLTLELLLPVNKMSSSVSIENDDKTDESLEEEESELESTCRVKLILGELSIDISKFEFK